MSYILGFISLLVVVFFCQDLNFPVFLHQGIFYHAVSHHESNQLTELWLQMNNVSLLSTEPGNGSQVT